MVIEEDVFFSVLPSLISVIYLRFLQEFSGHYVYISLPFHHAKSKSKLNERNCEEPHYRDVYYFLPGNAVHETFIICSLAVVICIELYKIRRYKTFLGHQYEYSINMNFKLDSANSFSEAITSIQKLFWLVLKLYFLCRFGHSKLPFEHARMWSPKGQNS